MNNRSRMQEKREAWMAEQIRKSQNAKTVTLPKLSQMIPVRSRFNYNVITSRQALPASVIRSLEAEAK